MPISVRSPESRMAAIVVLIVSVLLAEGVCISAQSLVELAEREAARRSAIASSAKLYTNADIVESGRLTVSAPQPDAPERPAVDSQTVDASGQPALTSKDAMAAPVLPRDEKFWRSRVAATHDKLDRAKLFLDALHSRVNGLATDFAARDDPAQRAVIASEREKALTEMARVRVEIADLTRELANLEEEARRTGVPAGWLRP
jgi:hypothetical protein